MGRCALRARTDRVEENRAESDTTSPDATKVARRTDNLLGRLWAHFEEEEEVRISQFDEGMSKMQFERELGKQGSAHCFASRDTASNAFGVRLSWCLIDGSSRATWASDAQSRKGTVHLRTRRGLSARNSGDCRTAEPSRPRTGRGLPSLQPERVRRRGGSREDEAVDRRGRRARDAVSVLHPQPYSCRHATRGGTWKPSGSPRRCAREAPTRTRPWHWIRSPATRQRGASNREDGRRPRID